MRLFSYKNRPVHFGPYPIERLKRNIQGLNLDSVPAFEPITFECYNDEKRMTGAIEHYAAMLDALRDGVVTKERGDIPSDPKERSAHLKSFGYYHDASQIGICRLSQSCLLETPVKNPALEKLANQIKEKQTKSMHPGIDVVMAELKDNIGSSPKSISHHSHAIVFLYEYPRDPGNNEQGSEWIQNLQAERASLLASETVAVISNYIRLLGYEARGHSGSTSDVDLNKLAVAAGLARVVNTAEGPKISNPYLGVHFGIGVITTTFELEPDEPLAESSEINFLDRVNSHGPAWWLGKGFKKNAFNARPYKNRDFFKGAYPFEKIKRVDTPTTFIDELRVPRVPKRSDMITRALFGDLGKKVQAATKDGNHVRKSPLSFGPRAPMAALVLMQDGDVSPEIHASTQDKQRNADNIKAALRFLGADAVGISRCPEWVYYSHDAMGDPIIPYHKNAISVVIDQGHETMEGASGDDWIAASQSMRAYLRFSLLGGVIAQHIRKLGYDARSHTVMDGEVLQPPLLLLSGLGEVSRIGEVILNPYLGPRLKSGVITTNMPLSHDKPIDFGLQKFCNNCNKCARECPSGAISAGPKKMFNGYEIWKSDSQKCTSYRLTNAKGAMCGRCMKTCPWNLEGLFSEAPFRWAASNIPNMAKALAKLDDTLGNGRINPIKKWWWDLEMTDNGPYTVTKSGTNTRELEIDLDLKPEDQTIAVYPAHMSPTPYPFPSPMNREEGIRAFNELLSPEEYKKRLKNEDTENLVTKFVEPEGPPPVIRVKISKVEKMSDDISKYEFKSLDGKDLPKFTAGAHIDVLVAPEYFRQYSLSGNPSDKSSYQIGVLREGEGRGGSALLHRIFTEGRKVFISSPNNHFPLDETARKTFLMGGGIGVTPMISMAHRLHSLGKDFEFHYSCKSRKQAAFLKDLKNFPWSKNINLYFSNDGTRIDFKKVFSGRYQPGYKLYTCGSDRYMSAVFDIALSSGWPEKALKKEHFTIPDEPDYENFKFNAKLLKSNKTLHVSEDKTLAEALLDSGVFINVKCADGLCGVCSCELISGEVEHRDHVLSAEQRKAQIITCKSRALKPNGEITLNI